MSIINALESIAQCEKLNAVVEKYDSKTKRVNEVQGMFLCLNKKESVQTSDIIHLVLLVGSSPFDFYFHV